MQFQEVSDGLVLLLGQLEDDPAWLCCWADGVFSPGAAAQVSDGVFPRSEWVWTVRWSQAGGHNRWWSVELETFKCLMVRKKQVLIKVLKVKNRFHYNTKES